MIAGSVLFTQDRWQGGRVVVLLFTVKKSSAFWMWDTFDVSREWTRTCSCAFRTWNWHRATFASSCSVVFIHDRRTSRTNRRVTSSVCRLPVSKVALCPSWGLYHTHKWGSIVSRLIVLRIILHRFSLSVICTIATRSCYSCMIKTQKVFQDSLLKNWSALTGNVSLWSKKVF